MALTLLNASLGDHPSTTLTWRLLDALLKALPEADHLADYTDLDGARAARFPELKMAGVALADELASDEDVRVALVAGRSIDAGSKGITVLTGLRSAIGVFLGTLQPAGVALDQQRVDAALKALALAFVVSRVLPGEPDDKVAALRRIPAGRQLILYFGTVELALPLAADIAGAEGSFLASLVERCTGDVAKRLVGVLGADGLDEAQAFLPALLGLLEETARFVVPHTEEVATTVEGLLPELVRTTIDLSMLAATGADALSSYACLVPRFVAEACLWRAAQAQAPLSGAAAVAALTGIQPADEGPPNPFHDDLARPAPVRGAPPAWAGSDVEAPAEFPGQLGSLEHLRGASPTLVGGDGDESGR